MWHTVDILQTHLQLGLHSEHFAVLNGPVKHTLMGQYQIAKPSEIYRNLWIGLPKASPPKMACKVRVF